MTTAWRRRLRWAAALLGVAVLTPWVLAVIGPRLCGWQAIEDGVAVALVTPVRDGVPTYEPVWPGGRLHPAEPPPKTAPVKQRVLAGELLIAEPVGTTSLTDAEWFEVGSVAPVGDAEGARLETQGGWAVRREDVRPASLTQLGFKWRRGRIGPIDLMPAITRMDHWAAAAQYQTRAAQVISVIYSDSHTVYAVDGENRIQVLLARRYSDPRPRSAPFRVMSPGVRASRGLSDVASPPDILAFMPPLGFVCWRYGGEHYRPGIPGIGQAIVLLGLWVRGCSPCLSALALIAILAVAIGYRRKLGIGGAVGCALLEFWGFLVLVWVLWMADLPEFGMALGVP